MSRLLVLEMVTRRDTKLWIISMKNDFFHALPTSFNKQYKLIYTGEHYYEASTPPEQQTLNLSQLYSPYLLSLSCPGH